MSIGILVDKLYNLNMPKKKSYIEDFGKVGRPTIFNDTVVTILDDSFRFGATVEQACALAKIDKVTYYRWIDSKPDFATKMEYARNYLNTMAKDLVKKAIIIDKDINTAKWLLEKTEFKPVNQSNTQVNITGPKSILDGFIDWKEDVQTNNNTKEDSKIKEEN
jgi:hypothetical protein